MPRRGQHPNLAVAGVRGDADASYHGPCTWPPEPDGSGDARRLQQRAERATGRRRVRLDNVRDRGRPRSPPRRRIRPRPGPRRNPPHDEANPAFPRARRIGRRRAGCVQQLEHPEPHRVPGGRKSGRVPGGREPGGVAGSGEPGRVPRGVAGLVLGQSFAPIPTPPADPAGGVGLSGGPDRELPNAVGCDAAAMSNERHIVSRQPRLPTLAVAPPPSPGHRPRKPRRGPRRAIRAGGAGRHSETMRCRSRRRCRPAPHPSFRPDSGLAVTAARSRRECQTVATTGRPNVGVV